MISGGLSGYNSNIIRGLAQLSGGAGWPHMGQDAGQFSIGKQLRMTMKNE